MTSHWKDTILSELRGSGTEPPCPFCKLPRVRRSDYVRCPRCLINWIDGLDPDLDHDPRSERMRRMLADTAMGRKTASAKKGEE
jgi:hypothetical protein